MEGPRQHFQCRVRFFTQTQGKRVPRQPWACLCDPVGVVDIRTLLSEGMPPFLRTTICLRFRESLLAIAKPYTALSQNQNTMVP